MNLILCAKFYYARESREQCQYQKIIVMPAFDQQFLSNLFSIRGEFLKNSLVHKALFESAKYPDRIKFKATEETYLCV